MARRDPIFTCFFPEAETREKAGLPPIDHGKTRLGVLIVCANKINNPSDFAHAMGHEFQHFADWCEKGSHGGNCESRLCREMRAFKSQGDCKSPETCWKVVKDMGYLTDYSDCAERFQTDEQRDQLRLLMINGCNITDGVMPPAVPVPPSL